MSVKHVLKLTEEEREELSRIARGSRGRRVIAGWKVTRARALLKCDQGPWGPAWPDHRIAEALEVTERSLQSWRKRAVLEGPAAALSRRLRVPVPRKVDGHLEAQITRLACSIPPEGRSRRTLRLLADKVVETGAGGFPIARDRSTDAKKNDLKPWRKVMWVHFPQAGRGLWWHAWNSYCISIHNPAFPPEEAQRVMDRLKLVFTPKHGSWLNIAEVELRPAYPSGSE